MSSTIVDSDILIDAGRQIPEAVEYLRAREAISTLAISAVTQMELIIGCRNKREYADLEKFLLRFRILPVTSDISDSTVALLSKYNLSHGLLIADALIAATAITYSEPLATKNQRDFRFIQDLDLMQYPS
jgi:predicted nucleic acid-binding protein